MTNISFPKFLHIYIDKRSSVNLDEVDKKMDKAIDWFRYDSKCYVVYTTSDVKTWQVRLLDLVKPGGNLFIAELNLKNRNGWMNKKFWEWIREKQ